MVVAMADRLAEPVDVRLASWLAPQQIPVPVVAAVNGPAVGAGLCPANAHSGQTQRAEGQGP